MSRRHLNRKTKREIAWEAVRGNLPLKEAATEFVALVNFEAQSGLSDIFPDALSVEQLASQVTSDALERAELEAKVRAFFWGWLDDETASDEAPPKIYPL